jgi:hypothetical protein
MPNFCTTRIQVTGPANDVARFHSNCFRTMDNGQWGFDFATIHPRPKAVDELPLRREIASGTSVLGFLEGRACDPIRQLSKAFRSWRVGTDGR